MQGKGMVRPGTRESGNNSGVRYNNYNPKINNDVDRKY